MNKNMMFFRIVSAIKSIYTKRVFGVDSKIEIWPDHCLNAFVNAFLF